MANADTTPEFAAELEHVSQAAQQSLARMSGAFSSWLHDTTRVQKEAVRFLGERFDKELAMAANLR